MTRDQMKALPIAQITARHARAGDLTVLSFAKETRYISLLYEDIPDLSRKCRAVAADPVSAHFVEQQIRALWTRLVDRSNGYFLNGRGLQVYADA